MSLNVKYEDLSVVGKVWTIREELNKGIINNDAGFIMSANKKLNEIVEAELYSTIYENDKVTPVANIDNLVENANNIKRKIVDGEDVSIDFECDDNSNMLSKIWKHRIILDKFRLKLRQHNVSREDFEKFDKAGEKFYNLYRKAYKNKDIYSYKVKRDLFKIYEELLQAYNKCRLRNEYVENELK